MPSLRAPDTSAAYLPVPPRAVPGGPLPAGTRYAYDADSLLLHSVLTLSDLLARVPGVYIARGGFYGVPEPVAYGGRGAQGLEVYWDGVPFLPLGRDSVWLDPARIPLAPLERIEVVILPASLRVYLVSRRPDSTDPETDIGIQTGDANAGGYRGTFARRWRSGVGLALKADLHATDGFAGTPTTEFRANDLWARLEYVPSPRYGATFQLGSVSWERDAGPAATGVDARDVVRNDQILSFFWQGRDDGLGPRVEAVAATSRTSSDTALAPDSGTPRTLASNAVYQTLFRAQWTWPRASVQGAINFGVNRIPLTLDVAAAWTPHRLITLSADARRARYEGARDGTRAHVAAGLNLPLGVSLRGDAAFGNDVSAPSILADSAQETTDLSWAVRWDRPWLTLEGGGGRRDGFTALGFAADLDPVARIGPTPTTQYMHAFASIRAVPGLTLSGWYFHPIAGGADFEPPHHARYAATFHSKFWRKFRSGAFALRAEVAAESWSAVGAGLGGRDSTNAQLPLQSGTFVDTNLEVQLLSFTLYWTIRNVNLMKTGYVADRPLRRSYQYYGARWTFRN